MGDNQPPGAQLPSCRAAALPHQRVITSNPLGHATSAHATLAQACVPDVCAIGIVAAVESLRRHVARGALPKG